MGDLAGSRSQHTCSLLLATCVSLTRLVTQKHQSPLCWGRSQPTTFSAGGPASSGFVALFYSGLVLAPSFSTPRPNASTCHAAGAKGGQRLNSSRHTAQEASLLQRLEQTPRGGFLPVLRRQLVYVRRPEAVHPDLLQGQLYPQGHFGIRSGDLGRRLRACCFPQRFAIEFAHFSWLSRPHVLQGESSILTDTLE